MAMLCIVATLSTPSSFHADDSFEGVFFLPLLNWHRVYGHGTGVESALTIVAQRVEVQPPVPRDSWLAEF